MATIKKYNGSTWENAVVRKYGTSTDTITTLPADVYADGNNATVGLVGNMVQSGSPSPSSPIQPQECGERTGNLFDEEYPNIDGTVRYRALNLGNGTYTLSSTVEISQGSAGTLFFLAGNVSSGASTATNAVYKDRPITVTSTDGYVTIAYRTYTTDTPVGKETMLNSGSTPLPYQPYGYVLPIKSGSTTTPVYLGEVESTRKIKKLVLTGEENWRYSTSSQVHWIENVPNDYNNTLISRITTVCTHYRCIQNNTGFSGMVNGDLRLYAKEASPIAHELYIKDDTYTTAEDFKTYLAQQYAAGTPVTIWYVLATEETGIVNEPLRKIGDYADSVTATNIPTTTGKDAFDVLTTLKPSEVSLSYTGWHDATVGEWDGSDWQ